MNRFAKFALIALIALGTFALLDLDDAEAGRRCGFYRPCYSTSYYVPTCHSTLIYPAVMPNYWGCGYRTNYYSGPLATPTPYGQLGW